MRWRAVGFTSALVALPAPALAHDAFGNAGAFWAGVLHPLTSLEHVLAIVAFGLLAGQQASKPAFAALVAFAGALAVGAALGATRLVALDLVQVAAATIAPFGLLVALALPLPAPLLVALGVGLGLVHGIANGEALRPTFGLVAFSAGVVLGPSVLVQLVMGVVRRLEVPWTRIAVRVLGSWLAAVGLLVLGSFAWVPASAGG